MVCIITTGLQTVNSVHRVENLALVPLHPARERRRTRGINSVNFNSLIFFNNIRKQWVN